MSPEWVLRDSDPECLCRALPEGGDERSGPCVWPACLTIAEASTLADVALAVELGAGSEKTS